MRQHAWRTSRALARVVVLGIWLSAAPSFAQENVHLSERARISVLTILPGDAVYSAFGHSAFRVLDPVTGYDLVYNYGTFDFEDPYFVPRFAYGALDYLLSLSSMRAALMGARVQERTVVEQVLTLSIPERDSLFFHLKVNARPENRAYRYDFLFDNCSTRLRDGLERVLPGLTWLSPGQPQSFRHHLDPYLVPSPWLHLGIDLVLGSRTDRVAGAREAQFLPMEFRAALDGATIQSDGTARPLVARQDTMVAFPVRADHPAPAPWPTIIGWILFLLAVVQTYLTRNRATAWSALDTWLFSVLGAVGVFLGVMWIGTLHHVTAANLNMLWALPTHLLFVGIRRRLPPTVVRGYLAVTILLATLSLTGGWLLPQAIPAALVPIVLISIVRSGFGIRGSAA